MADVNKLVTEHIDVWTNAIKKRNSQGRGSSKKTELAGIKKLRDLILELAVRGKLVPQDAADESAAILLDKIAVKKEQLIADKKIKKQKPLLEIVIEEKTLLPKGWEMTQLGQIAEIGPRNIIEDNIDVSFVPMPLISKSYKGEHEQEIRKWSEIKKGYTHFSNGDIAVAKITPCFENSKAAIFTGLKNGFGAGTTELHVARLIGEYVNRLYVLLYLKSPEFLLVGQTKMTGTAGQKRLPSDFFSSNPLPLPPLNEQHRIVAKVDELMLLCDDLEQQTEDSISAHQTLVEVLLATLTNPTQTISDSADGFQQNWQRIVEHFDVLFTTEHSIEQLKLTILQLAVMGKLVPQNSKDEPASVLLERITKEKEQLIADKKVKKQKPLPAITSEEKPFVKPIGWEWIRFASLSNEVATGPFGSMVHKSDYVVNGTPLINPSHMIHSVIKEDLTISVNKQKAKELETHKLCEGDIVMARRGEMGRCALVTSREVGWLCGTGSFVLRFHHSLSRAYILLLFKTEYVRDYLGGNSIGTTMTNLNHGILNKLPLMLPPIQEQNRIIGRVNELMVLCEQLKVRLSEAQTTQLKLADTIVSQAVN